MELNKQVCSLELAQKMKELGFKQESLFYWNQGIVCDSSFKVIPEACSAYTVAELEIYLPTNVVCKNTAFDEVLVKLLDEEGETIYFTREEKGADARAKMLIYLVENKLITV